MSAAVLFILLAVSGCACLGHGPPAAAVSVDRPKEEMSSGWWAARFKLDWPAGAEPFWSADLILAHRVVAPVLQQHGSAIVLWRFHRRAARDRIGHQFSFVFYASPSTAEQVYHSISSNTVLQQLRKAGIVVRVGYESTARIAKPRIEDTSDPAWSPAVQKSWPYFIMGVSQTWLGLIDLTVPEVAEGDRPASSVEELKTLYLAVNERIGDLWQRQGSHAFLHHLNALFGYVPVQFYEKRLLTF